MDLVNYHKQGGVPSNIRCIHWMSRGRGLLIGFPTFICHIPVTLKFENISIIAGTTEKTHIDGSSINARFNEISDILQLHDGDFLISDMFCIRLLSKDLKFVSTIAGNPFERYDWNEFNGGDPNGSFTNEPGRDKIAVFSGPTKMAYHPKDKNKILVIDRDKDIPEINYIRELDLDKRCVNTAIGSQSQHCLNSIDCDDLSKVCFYKINTIISNQHADTILFDGEYFSTFNGEKYKHQSLPCIIEYESDGLIHDEIGYPVDHPELIPNEGQLLSFKFDEPIDTAFVNNDNLLIVDYGIARLVDLKTRYVSTPNFPENIIPKIIERMSDGYILMIASENNEDYLFVIELSKFVKKSKPPPKLQHKKRHIDLFNSTVLEKKSKKK